MDLPGDALDAHIGRVMQVFDSKAYMERFAKMAPFEKVVLGEYSLSVSNYVEAKDNREAVEIAQFNAELARRGRQWQSDGLRQPGLSLPGFVDDEVVEDKMDFPSAPVYGLRFFQ